ncbi:MAG TPA: c-type cytochrome [Noviherbaspirillum sp.]|nr:c-type cytochrome [Noviherbaspirillum sp.]
MRSVRKAIQVAFGAALLTGLASAQTISNWQAPEIDKLPNDHYGKMVRQGKVLMEQTYKYLGPEAKDTTKRFAGNNLACVTCHIAAGTRHFGNPWVGTFVSFPQYRGREDTISTTEERINGCMERSMSGRRMPTDSEEMKAMVAYLHFLSSGIPVGAKMEGTGVPRLNLLDRAADPVAGQKVYATVCQACHGENGQGVRRGKPGDGEGYQFPPLWGPDSYNTGAGMYRNILAAGFIKGNMPSGVTHANMVLTDEQAFDVAAYINSQPRPVKANLEADFPARKNKPVDSAFPPYTPGFSPEQHKYGPWQPLLEARKQGVYPPK